MAAAYQRSDCYKIKVQNFNLNMRMVQNDFTTKGHLVHLSHHITLKNTKNIPWRALTRGWYNIAALCIHIT